MTNRVFCKLALYGSLKKGSIVLCVTKKPISMYTKTQKEPLIKQKPYPDWGHLKFVMVYLIMCEHNRGCISQLI